MSITPEQLEDIICSILIEVTGWSAEEIDREASFGSLGLDSVSQVGLITQLGQRLGNRLETENLHNARTIRELACDVHAFIGKK